MNEKINLQSLVNFLVIKHGLKKKEAELFVKEFFALIEQGLEQDSYVKIKGLGTFKLIGVENRESINVNTGERFEIQGYTKISFTPDASLRDAINKPFAHFETVLLSDDTILEEELIQEELTQEESIQEELAQEESTQNETIQNEIEDTQSEEVIHESNMAERLSVEEIIARELANTDMRVRRKEPEEPHVPKTVKSVTLPEQTASKKEVPKDRGSNKSKRKPSVGYAITMIVIVILLCAGGVLYIYYPDMFSFVGDKMEYRENKETAPAEEPVLQGDTVLTVINKGLVPDTAIVPLEEVKKATSDKGKVTPAPVEKKETLQANLKYKITGTLAMHVMTLGETIRSISLHYYGTKEYWNYIVQYNNDVIKDPNNVPVGVTLKIPELKEADK